VRQPSPYIRQWAPPPNGAELHPAIDPAIFDHHAPSIKDYWLTVRKHFGVLVAVLIASVFITTLVVFTITPIYTAQVTILIEPNEPNVLDIKQVLTESLFHNDDYFKTEYELLKSRTLAAEVIRQQDLATNPIFTGARSNSSSQGLISGWLNRIWSHFKSSSATAASSKNANSAADDASLGVPSGLVSAYLGALQVKPEPGTRLVNLSFSSPDPQFSARLANAHAETFIHRGLELRSEANEEAQRFLQEKLVELKERVERSEEALNAYRRDKGILPLNGKEDLVVQRLDGLSSDLMRAESNRINLEAQQRLIEKGQFESLPSVAGSSLEPIRK
jgi:GumC protein